MRTIQAQSRSGPSYTDLAHLSVGKRLMLEGWAKTPYGAGYRLAVAVSEALAGEYPASEVFTHFANGAIFKVWAMVHALDVRQWLKSEPLVHASENR